MSIDWSIVLKKTVAVLFIVAPTVWLLRAFWSTQNSAKYGSRKRSAAAIEKLQRKRAIKQLINVFNFSIARNLEHQRFWTTSALGELKDPRAIEPLTRALAGAKDLDVVKDVAPALARHGKPALEILSSLLDQLGRPDENDPWNWRLTDIVTEVVRGLGESRDKACVPLLIEMMQGNCSRIARAAAEALGKIRDPRAIKPLREEQWSKKVSREVLYAALRACENRDITDELTPDEKRTRKASTLPPNAKKQEQVASEVCPHCGRQAIIVAALCPHCGNPK